MAQTNREKDLPIGRVDRLSPTQPSMGVDEGSGEVTRAERDDRGPYQPGLNFEIVNLPVRFQSDSSVIIASSRELFEAYRSFHQASYEKADDISEVIRATLEKAAAVSADRLTADANALCVVPFVEPVELVRPDIELLGRPLGRLTAYDGFFNSISGVAVAAVPEPGEIRDLLNLARTIVEEQLHSTICRVVQIDCRELGDYSQLPDLSRKRSLVKKEVVRQGMMHRDERGNLRNVGLEEAFVKWAGAEILREAYVQVAGLKPFSGLREEFINGLRAEQSGITVPFTTSPLYFLVKYELSTFMKGLGRQVPSELLWAHIAEGKDMNSRVLDYYPYTLAMQEFARATAELFGIAVDSKNSIDIARETGRKIISLDRLTGTGEVDRLLHGLLSAEDYEFITNVQTHEKQRNQKPDDKLDEISAAIQIMHKKQQEIRSLQ